ncbi:hypothetical protein QUH67_27800 [Bradyrhizobium roseum]|nr:hypothetical protein QUH67_27800 [Bradyrhizobium roseus]
MHAQHDRSARQRTRRPRPPVTTGKSQTELTQIADDALRGQPGCATASVPAVRGLSNIREGRNWEIPNVILGDCLISDVDRAVMSVQRQLGRKYHLVDRD